MDEKPAFGEIAAEDLKVGDIVEWSKWNKEMLDWKAHYGVIIEIKNEIKANRMVSVSIVTPLSGDYIEMGLFTPSLKLVSRANNGTDE